MKKAYADGAFDALHARRRAEAEAGYAALRDEGEAGAAKADRLEKDADRFKKLRKRKKEKGEARALDETRLKEQVAVLSKRLGRGATVLDLDDDDGDEYGGVRETPEYRAQEAAIKTLEAKEDIRRAENALAAKRGRARKRVEAEKAERRVALLKIRVAELEEEFRAAGGTA